MSNPYRKETTVLVATSQYDAPIGPEPTPTPGGFGTYSCLEERYAAVLALRLEGYNYFVGFRDSGDPAKPFGLSYAYAVWAGRIRGCVKDLHALIH